MGVERARASRFRQAFAHADVSRVNFVGIFDTVGGIERAGTPPSEIRLVYGDEQAKRVMAAELKAQGIGDVWVPCCI